MFTLHKYTHTRKKQVYISLYANTRFENTALFVYIRFSINDQVIWLENLRCNIVNCNIA